jgi:hypothetical protein
MPVQREHFKQPGEEARLGLHLPFSANADLRNAKGEVFLTVTDAEGQVLEERHVPNVITADAGILVAILLNSPTSRNGANMLAVGTGATGSLLSPDAPSPNQRKLNAEITRKAWSSIVYRDASGNAVAIPTNVIDFTVTYDESEAVGPLNEMGILSTISNNPLTKNENPDTYPTRDVTQDLTLYDILMNYVTFAVLSIPATARFSVTWRITF